MAIRGERVFVGAAALLSCDAKLKHLAGKIVLNVSTLKSLLGGHSPRRITLTSRTPRRSTSGLMLCDYHFEARWSWQRQVLVRMAVHVRGEEPSFYPHR